MYGFVKGQAHDNRLILEMRGKAQPAWMSVAGRP